MNKQKNKGITLVALVITIIILLILAGITISQLTGSGLFENAKLAAEKSKNSQEKEEGILADYENKMGQYLDASRGTVTIPEEEYNMLINANSYSTTEKRIGTWINGKPLYRKSYNVNTPSTAETDTKIITLDNEIVVVEITGITSQGIPVNYFYNSEWHINTRFVGHEIRQQVNGYLNVAETITLLYTKTTD